MTKREATRPDPRTQGPEADFKNIMNPKQYVNLIKLKPLMNRVLLVVDHESQDSIIYVTRGAKQRQSLIQKGYIISKGEQADPDLQKGDWIYFSKLFGKECPTPVDFPGVKLWLIRDYDILGIIEETEKNEKN